MADTISTLGANAAVVRKDALASAGTDVKTPVNERSARAATVGGKTFALQSAPQAANRDAIAGVSLAASTRLRDTRGLKSSGSEAFGPVVASAVTNKVTVERMADKTGVARTLDYVALTTNDGEKHVPRSQVFAGKPADLIIGIDVTGNTQGHMYLIIDGTRIDGRMFFKGQDESRGDPKISDGLVIAYRNLPEENKRRLIDWVRSDDTIHAPSCVATACRVLYGHGGLTSGPDRPRYWFPSTFLRNIAQHHLQGADGQQLKPEIYTIDCDIDRFWNNLPTWKSAYKFLLPVFKNTFFGSSK